MNIWSSSSPWLKGEKGSTRSIVRTTLPHGHESTQGPGTDTRIVDRDERVAGHGRASVLSAVESGPGHARVRRVCRGAMRPVLRRDSRPSKSAAGDLLPAAVDWGRRGDRFGARDCLVHRGFAGATGLPGAGPGRGPTRALDDFADAAPDRSGDAPGGLYLDPAGARDDRSRHGTDDRDRCHNA